MVTNEFKWSRAYVENGYGPWDKGGIKTQQRIDAVYGKGAFRKKRVWKDRVTIEIMEGTL